MKNLKLVFMIVSCLYGLNSTVQAQVTIDYNSSSGDPTLLLYETESDFARMYFKNTNDSMGEYWSMSARVSELDENSRLHFYNKGISSSGYVLAMTGDQRVGIGTINPDARLTVKQALDTDDMGLRLVDFSGNNYGNLWMNGSDFRIHNGSGVSHGFTIKNDKRIGVFTQNPEASFDIYENDVSYTNGIFSVRRKPSIPIASKLLFEVQGDDDTYALRLGVNEEDPSDRLHVNSSANENALRVQVGGSTKLRVLSNGGTAIGVNAAVVPTDGLYVHGNVHVGTTVGATGYTMAVDGKVICEELTVQLSGSWPDYVFEDDYDIKSIHELEQYISKHKHLPGVPSAVEIEERGIHMSEVSAALLEKIEELTLHTIRQEKILQHQAELINSILEKKE